MTKFKVGDLVYAMNNMYRVTNRKFSYVGKVVRTESQGAAIEIVEVFSLCKDRRAKSFRVNARHFRLLTPLSRALYLDATYDKV